MFYDKESIYVLNGDKLEDISVSYGVIKDIKKNELIYSGNLRENSMLSPIFNLSTNKLIGFHKKFTKYYNRGVFLNSAINKFISPLNRIEIK